jgi:hypothetical protein
MDEFIRWTEKNKKKGRILPFVRGLRLSSRLIYAIRDSISQSPFAVDWGHLVDENEKYVSPECDIIIYRKDNDAILEHWNGIVNQSRRADSIMDFKFVRKRFVKLVISCKSLIKTSEIDKKYCKDLKKYVKNVWLFAECCGPRSVKAILKNAKKFGYQDFFYLYTWSPKSSPAENLDGWQDFIKKIKRNSKLPNSR